MRPVPGMTFVPGETTSGSVAGAHAGAVSTGDDAELQPLLRSRMIFIGAAGVAQWIIFALSMARAFFGVKMIAEEVLAFQIGTVVAAIYSLITILLLCGRSMPVPRLRMLELVAVALVVVLDVRNTIATSTPAGSELLRDADVPDPDRRLRHIQFGTDQRLPARGCDGPQSR